MPIENNKQTEQKHEELPTTEVAEGVMLETFQNTQALGTLLSATKTAKKKGANITALLDKVFQR